MKHRLCIALSGLGLAAAMGASRAEPVEGELTPLFNGKDLTGWVNVNCAPATFTARDGMVVSTGVPTGVLRTERMYENFVLEVEWRHMKAGGNAGVFVWSDPLTAPGVPFARAIEVQVLDGRNSETHTSHGDLFSIHGATMKPDRPHPEGWMRCLPSERRARPSPEWNHYRITARDGVIKLEVNGKEVSGGSGCSPRKGYLCLESEGSECHFRNIRLQELPSSGAKPEETADEAQGFRPLYTGLELSGWRAGETEKEQWKPRNWILECRGESPLATVKEHGDFILICDWQVAGESKRDGAKEKEAKGPGAAFIRLRGSEKGEVPLGGAPPDAARKPGEWNRSVITLRGDRMTTTLNGKAVDSDKKLEGLPARGPITLIGRGGTVSFGNLYLRDLPD